jgi:hypothetical protein
MKTLSEDTSPEAERVLVELWRRASTERKCALIIDTTHSLREFVLAGLRERYPNESAARLRRHFADAWLGPVLAQNAYGSFPHDGQ